MLLSLPQTHICKSVILVRTVAIFIMQIWYTNPKPKKTFRKWHFLFSLPKYDSKGNF